MFRRFGCWVNDVVIWVIMLFWMDILILMNGIFGDLGKLFEFVGVDFGFGGFVGFVGYLVKKVLGFYVYLVVVGL